MCIPILNDWFELGTIAALIAVIYQIVIERKARKIDVAYAQEQADRMRIVAENSTEQLSILSDLLRIMTDKNLNENQKGAAEEDLGRRQRLLDIRPFFVRKSGETTGHRWKIELRNRGMNIKPGTFRIKRQGAGIEINPINHEIDPVERKDRIKIQGQVATEIFSSHGRRVEVSFSIGYQDEDGNEYEQSVSFDSDWEGSITGDPQLI